MGGHTTKSHTDRSLGFNDAGVDESRPARFDERGFVDVHCHCLAGLDDGPTTMAEALELCRGLVADCITHVVATPHQLGRYSGCNEAAEIRDAVLSLNDSLRRHSIPLNVYPGGDIRVDERICELLEADKILTLADGGRYVLLELPHEVFINIEPLLAELCSRGIEAIISHPERHPALAGQPKVLERWFRDYAHLQVTAGSFLGEFGPAAQNAAWQFLSSGWVSLVATDSHDMNGRSPRMTAACRQIAARFGESIARLVCVENPMMVLRSQGMQPAGSMLLGKRIHDGIFNIS